MPLPPHTLWVRHAGRVRVHANETPPTRRERPARRAGACKHLRYVYRAGGPRGFAVTAEATGALAGGVPIPLVGFGTWQLRGRHAYESVVYALRAGYRHLDTATMYRNEAEVGRAVRDADVPRREVFVTTKLPSGNAGRERATIDASLRALGLTYVDLWLVHGPPGGRARPDTWREFLAVRDDGLARTVGVSNYSVRQLDELITATGQAPAVNQIPWGPTLHDPRVLAEHRARGVLVEGYSPLKNTDLRDPVLASVAAAHGVTPAQVVLRWHVQHGIVVIPKSGNPERIAANLAIFDFDLTADEMARIDGLSRGNRR